jgi:hypothetical protein
MGLICIMKVGEGGAPLGDELFDLLKTELIFGRHRNVCGVVKVSNIVRSNQLVYCGDVTA